MRPLRIYRINNNTSSRDGGENNVFIPIEQMFNTRY